MRRFLLGIVFICLFTIPALAVPIMRIQPLTISVQSTTTTVAATATKIPATALVGRESIAIVLNDSTDTVFIGGADVTAANGFRLDSTVPAITIDMDSSVDIYGIVSAGTADVRALEAK